MEKANTTAKKSKSALRPSSLNTNYLEHGKVPPQAVDLEEAVLGAIMLEQDAVSAVIDILKPEVFYKEAHQKIFSAILRLFSKSEPVDILTVTNELKSSGELEMVGGPYYITMLTSRIASASNVEYHARIILQKHIQRELIKISSGIIKDAFEDTTDVFDLLDRRRSLLAGIIRKGQAQGVHRSDLVAEDAAGLIAEAIQGLSMRWLLDGCAYDLADSGPRMLAPLFDGFRA